MSGKLILIITSGGQRVLKNLDIIVQDVTSAGFENQILHTIVIYPDPVRHKLTIDYNGFDPSSHTIRIYNVNGQIIRNVNVIFCREMEDTT